MCTKKYKDKWLKLHPDYARKYNKKYYKNKYDSDPVYRKKCIASAIKWAKNNPDKVKVIQKRYYGANAVKLCRKSLAWHNSEEGQEWYKEYYGSDSQIASVQKYYKNNAKKWDRYRYKWLLKGMDVHEKNLRIAELFIKRINKFTNYRIDESEDIKMQSNGQADINIKLPNKRYVDKLREESIYWADNFNRYNKTKINVMVKARQDIKSSYKAIVSFN